MSNQEPLLISKKDFACIGQVAEHCNWDDLCIYIREQQNLSLLPKIGWCIYDLLMRYQQGWCLSGTYEGQDVIKHLFCGGRYTACDGTIKMHFGLMRSLTHWAYGAYMENRGYVDTPFGAVQKVNEDSVPVSESALKSINIRHRTNAEYYLDFTLDYLCSVKNQEPLSSCKICDCNSDCSCNKCSYCKNNKKGTLQRGRIPRFKTISRY